MHKNQCLELARDTTNFLYFALYTVLSFDMNKLIHVFQLIIKHLI